MNQNLEPEAKHQLHQVFSDGSSVAKRPTELVWVYDSSNEVGVYAPPMVWGPWISDGRHKTNQFLIL